MEKQIYSVTEISLQIKYLVEDSLKNIWVEGEVSNLKYHTSGHIYFSLKDEKSTINAVIWAGLSGSIKFRLEDGLKITAFCKATTYSMRSQYQLVVLNAVPSGKGALQLAFEQLKKKLQQEGLFDDSRKKPIPFLPQKIAVITSPTGAAIKDIISVLKRRYSNVELLVMPVRVQGDEAKDEIAQAVSDVNIHFPDMDIVILARGGGSMEDLWPFNEEVVARAICSSRIPVISAVGHEVDYTIADFVSDRRAPTPSAAAEMILKTKSEFAEKIKYFSVRLESILSAKIQNLSARVGFLASSRFFADPFVFIEEKIQKINDLAEKLKLALSHSVEIAEYKMSELSQRLRINTVHSLELTNHRMQKQIEKLGILSPLACLSRGYSVVWSLPDRKIVRSSREVSGGQALLIKLHKGEIKAVAESVKED